MLWMKQVCSKLQCPCSIDSRNESWEVDKIGLSNRVAVPHTEAADPCVRNAVTHSKVSLTLKRLWSPSEISELYATQHLSRVEA